MILSSNGKKPTVHPSAYVAPNAVLSGDVTIEEGCAVLYGAVITAEGAPVVVGANTVVMENAVLKSSGGSAIQFPLSVGESCIIGPGAYIVGAALDPGVFIAAGAKVFNGATIEEGVSVALGGIVHINTRVPSGMSVPMQHIAYGDPAKIHPPREAPEVHKQMNFFESVFNLPYTDDVRAKAADAYSKFLRKTHAQDAPIVETSSTKKLPAKGAAAGKTREEPPPTQSADVAKVLDVTFMELEEARMRREAALERERRGKVK
ncbi:MAG: gamma carbonic anhydrase family protein [Candidatus Eremiobacteraeota bacterium]|nr:gamma carbonic anhydrase family protein [Candidatus Eremiobacteraeota bacterium]